MNKTTLTLKHGKNKLKMSATYGYYTIKTDRWTFSDLEELIEQVQAFINLDTKLVGGDYEGNLYI